MVAAARRLVTLERNELLRKSIKLAGDPTGWRATVSEFYQRHAERIAGDLQMPPSLVSRYVEARKEDALAGGVARVNAWGDDAVSELVNLATA